MTTPRALLASITLSLGLAMAAVVVAQGSPSARVAAGPPGRLPRRWLGRRPSC